MMTIKHISISGRERVNAVVEVCYWPPEAQPESAKVSRPPGASQLRAYVEYVGAHGDGGRHIDGTVFLMNEKGATVSRWDLGASPVPLRDDVTGTNVRQKIVAD